MKKLILTALCIVIFVTGIQSQEKALIKIDKNDSTFTFQNKQNGVDTINKLTLDKAENKYGKINEKVSFGISLGLNSATENLKSAQISPINNTLIIDNLQQTSFVISSVISVPLSYKSRKVYRRLDKDGVPIGQIYKISNWSAIGIVNLATFSEAQSGSIFNQQVSGGLGMSYNINEDVAFGLSFELISYRKPKDFLIQLNGQEVIVNNNIITSLDISDNNFFFDRYASTLSLKIIYKLTTN